MREPTGKGAGEPGLPNKGSVQRGSAWSLGFTGRLGLKPWVKSQGETLGVNPQVQPRL